MSVNAQETEADPRGITLAVLVEKGGSPGMLGSVIADSMALEFLLNDFRVRISDQAEDGASPDQKRALLMAEAAASGGLYLLEGRYRVEEDRVALRIECLRTDRETAVYTGEEEHPVDLNLDNAIQLFIRKAIAEIQKDLGEDPVYAPPADTGEETAGQEDSEGSGAEPGGDGEFAGEPGVASSVTDDSDEQQDRSVPPDSPGAGLIAAAELGLFIPVGTSGDYFDMGYVPALSALYPLILPFGILEIGGFFSLNIIHAEGRLNSSQNLLFFFAPQARYRLPLGERFALSVRLAAGGSLLMVNRNGEGYQGVLIPAFQTGLGGEFALRESFGLFWGVDLSMSFEESITITGIQPSAGVYYRL